jgi:hypothetical protein
MDQHNDSHLAVIGIERDTKDGHYHYTAVRGCCWLLRQLALLLCLDVGQRSLLASQAYHLPTPSVTQHAGD